MARKLLNGAVSCLFGLTFASGTLLAQNRIQDFVRIAPSLDIAPYHQNAGTAKRIFSTIGPTASDAYNDTNGYCVTGTAQSSCGTSEQWIGVPFTPTRAAHATVLEAAIQYFAGTNTFQLSLYNDVSGAPGTALKTVEVSNAPAAGTCCTMSFANLGSPGVALTANTQYWVVANSDDSRAANFSGYWAFANAFIAYNPSQTGWITFDNSFPQEAVVVEGTFP